jgi:hypothetical protein
MDNIFSSPGLFDNFHSVAVTYYRNVRQQGGFDNKTLKLKLGDILAGVRATAVIWEDK